MNLYDSIRDTAASRGDATALYTVGGERISYRELDGAVARLCGLLDVLGLRVGDRAAVQVEKSPASLLLYLACLRSGVVYLPLNTAYTERELDFFLRDAAPSILVCDPAREQALRALLARLCDSRLLTLDANGEGSLAGALAGVESRHDVVQVDDDSLAAILYTSGTTGRPKGAMITHRNLSSNARALVQVWAFTETDVLLHALPIFHAHGLFTAVHCALLSGATMLFLPRFDAAAVQRMLPGATVMMGVPTYYGRLLREPGFGPESCATMRLFISGSAPLSVETQRAFRERTGHEIRERYGTTESMIVSAVGLDVTPPPGSVGRALPGIAVRIIDKAGNPAAPGDTGRVQVRGPNVFRGYWQLPERTAEAIDPRGWFTTGDLGSVDGGGWLHLAGRESDMIISGGFNVYPKEVEDVLDAIPGVQESAVVGVPHPDFGEGVLALVRVDPGGAAPGEAAIIAALRTRLAGYKIPKRVCTVDELPRNRMGKILKNELRAAYANTFNAGKP